MAPEISDVAAGQIIASNWGNLIRDRVVQRYATATQRGTESPSPGEGDLSYLEDSNTIWVYDGAAWVEIFAGTVETGDIANDAVTNAKIAPGAVDTTEIANDAVTQDKIAPNSVTTSKIVNQTITTVDILQDGVDGNRLVPGSVDATRLDGDVASAFERDNSTEVGSVSITADSGMTSYTQAASVSLSIPAGWGSWKCEAYATMKMGGSAVNLNVKLRIDGTDQQTLVTIAGQALSVGGRRTGMTTTGSRTVALFAVQDDSVNRTLGDIYLYARAVRTS